MRMAGSAVVHASPDQVWEALGDPAVLVRIIRGCRDVQRAGDGIYRVRADVVVASIAGTCDGQVEVTDADPPNAGTVRVTAGGEVGTIQATATVELAEDGASRTQVRYHADAEVGGALGSVGQRVLVSAAQRAAAQFFEALDRYHAGEFEPAAPVHPVVDRELDAEDMLVEPPLPPAPSNARHLLLAGLAGAVIAAFVMLCVRGVRASASEPAGGDRRVRASASEPAGGDRRNAR